MSDAREDLERAIREIGEELGRGVESLSRLARQASGDMSRFAAPVRPAPPQGPPPKQTPMSMIRELAALRDEGYITDEEYEVKKADLLDRI